MNQRTCDYIGTQIGWEPPEGFEAERFGPLGKLLAEIQASERCFQFNFRTYNLFRGNIGSKENVMISEARWVVNTLNFHVISSKMLL